MTRIADDLINRIAVIEKMIVTAKGKERRRLQTERAELEATLRKLAS